MNAIGGFFCCMHAVVDVLNERARAGFDTHKVEVVTHYGPTGWAEGKATAAGIDRKRPRGHQTRRPRFQGSTQSINIEWIGPLNPPDARPFSQEAKPADRPAMRPPRVRDDRRAGTPCRRRRRRPCRPPRHQCHRIQLIFPCHQTIHEPKHRDHADAGGRLHGGAAAQVGGEGPVSHSFARRPLRRVVGWTDGPMGWMPVLLDWHRPRLSGHATNIALTMPAHYHPPRPDSGPIPEAAPAPTTPGVSAAPGGDLGALVSNEALDALNTIQVRSPN